MMKLIEIVESANIDMDMKVDLPTHFQSRVDQFCKQHIFLTALRLYFLIFSDAAQRVSGYTLMIKELLEKVSDRFKLSIELGSRIGSLLPSLIDTKNKVAIEVVGVIAQLDSALLIQLDLVLLIRSLSLTSNFYCSLCSVGYLFFLAH